MTENGGAILGHGSGGTPNSSASAIEIAKAKLQLLGARKDIKPSLDLVECIVLGPGQLRISINAEKLGALLEHNLEDIPQDQLSITAPFKLRKRGVETKLVFADALVAPLISVGGR